MIEKQDDRQDLSERLLTRDEILAQLGVEKLNFILDLTRRKIIKRAYWSIGIGLVVVLAHVFYAVYEGLAWQSVARSIFLLFGTIAIFVGLLDWRAARKMTVDDLIPTPESETFARQYAATTPYFTYILFGCCILVFLFQMSVGMNFSIESASFYGEALQNGEWFRVLTSALMHGGLLHIFMNGQAFISFGRHIEALSNRVHVATIFLASAVGGNLFSYWLMPSDAATVGASGGIMGLLGFLAVFGHRRKVELPAGFLGNILMNLALIGVIGVVGFAFINNAAHFGGLMVGALYGFLVISKDRTINPKQAGFAEKILGYLSLAIIAATVIFIAFRFGIIAP